MDVTTNRIENSRLRTSSILRVVLSIIGMAVVLWPVWLDPTYTLHPWLVGPVFFGVTLLLFETILRQLSWVHSASTWKMVGFAFVLFLLFNAVCGALMFNFGLMGIRGEWAIGDKLMNAVIRLPSLRTDFGYVFGWAFLIDALVSRRRKQNEAAYIASGLSRRAHSHQEPEVDLVFQKTLKVVVIGSGIWLFVALWIGAGFAGPNVFEWLELFDKPYNNTLAIWMLSLVSAVITLIALKLFCPADKSWSSARLANPIALITLAYVCLILSLVLEEASMVDGSFVNESYYIAADLISSLMLVLNFWGVISAFAALNDTSRVDEGNDASQ